MAKPIIKTMTPFDASANYMVSFVWTGNMAYNNRLVIYDSETMTSVYDHTYPTNYYRLTHEIPADTLQNGMKYAAQIQVIDKEGVASDLSDKVYFWVLSTPTFYIEGLDPYDDNVVDNSSFIASLYYAQQDGDALDSYQFFLYSSSRELLDQSDLLKNSSGQQYTFRSLENDVSYFVRATGYTKKNVPLDTGYVSMRVHYTDPTFYSRMNATVNKTVGTVDYYTNLVHIESDKGSAAYNYEDGYVNLVDLDENATLQIATEGNLSPRIIARYLDVNGANMSVSGDGSVIVKKYSSVSSIELRGRTETVRLPYVSLNNYLEGSYETVSSCDFVIGDNIVTNIINNHPLRALPGNIYDRLMLESDGTRVIYQNVGEIIISNTLPMVGTATKTNSYGRTMFVAYYDVGAKDGMGAGNLYCDNLPVDGDTTSILLTSEGYLAIQWDRPETSVTNTSTALSWLRRHPLKVCYPLKNSTTLFLDSVAMPNMKNTNSVRYSTNFVVPAENATFSVRMKDAFKTSEILRVSSGDTTCFVVTSTVYDNGSLRYKLEVNGSVSDYIIYSEPLRFNWWDVVTLHVRRVNGVYDMVAFITEMDPNDPRNIWYMTREPSEAQERDVWIDIDYPTSYVDKDTVVRYYQNETPTDALAYSSIWIGGDE